MSIDYDWNEMRNTTITYASGSKAEVYSFECIILLEQYSAWSKNWKVYNAMQV